MNNAAAPAVPPRYYYPMKKIRWHLTVLFVLSTLSIVGLLLVVAGSFGQLWSQSAALIVSYVAPPTVSAKAVLIVDETTGKEIYSKRPDEVLPIASVTKLVTSAVFYKDADQAASSTITWSDVLTDGRAGRLHDGQVYQNHDLLFPALLESSNDAAAAMGRIAPGDLVAAMNQFAAAHNASQTHFADTSGLSDHNVSTAHDLWQLLMAVLYEEPHIIDITTLPTYLNHINAWMNNNPFIDDPTYRGGKHGYTPAANRTVVARFEETVGGRTRTIDYIMLGSDNLTADMQVLRTFVHHAVSLRPSLPHQ